MPYNKHLISLVCSARTASYGSSFFFLPYFHGPRTSHLCHKRKGKNMVHNLPYGPHTRLIRDMYVCLRIVNFRVKVWVSYVVFLSNRIFRSKSERRTFFPLHLVCSKFFLTSFRTLIFLAFTPRRNFIQVLLPCTILFATLQSLFLWSISSLPFGR